MHGTILIVSVRIRYAWYHTHSIRKDKVCMGSIAWTCHLD